MPTVVFCGKVSAVAPGPDVLIFAVFTSQASRGGETRGNEAGSAHQTSTQK
jgi:hypothetical protein